jgi:tagatose 6-phosphate kinase
MAKVLVVGLNPAWQSILDFKALRFGEVNRAHDAKRLASGKGINTAKVLNRLGHEVWLLQILGGANGRRCLEAVENLGIRSVAAWAETETRQCITLLDGVTGLATEIIEPFHVGKAGLDQELLANLPVDADTFAGLAICGTIPAGVSETIYDELLARYPTAISVVDAWQGIQSKSLSKATCLKMNVDELGAVESRLGRELPSVQGPFWAITAGASQAFLNKDGKTLTRFSIPKLTNAINPIGAGDTVTGGMLHHLLQGVDTAEAFRRSLAMGTASCLDRMPSEFAEADYERLLPLVKMTHV